MQNTKLILKRASVDFAVDIFVFLSSAEDPVPEARMEDIDDLDGHWSGKQSIERLDSQLDVPRRRRADSLSVITVDTADLDCQFTRPDEEMIDKMIEEEKSKTGQVSN